MTRIGVIARTEDRGLGHLTWEAWRHLDDVSALVIHPGVHGQGFAQHIDRFAPYGLGQGQSRMVAWTDDQQLQERDVRAWLETVDVVYSAETFYDRRLPGWARDAGVATVLHTMPELHHVDQGDDVDVIWCPTPWHMTEIQARHTTPVRLVPVPVALERFGDGSWRSPSVNVLHVAGHAAYQDRNGTKIAAAASHLFNPGIAYGVISQDDTVALGKGHRLPSWDTYWQLYGGADVLLMPRRFGGLCLPIQEASAAGLAIIALDTEPHDWYGCADVEATVIGDFETGSGLVEIYTARPADVADAVNAVAHGTLGGVRILDERRGKARDWAEQHSWDALLPTWYDELTRAVAAL